MAARQGLLATLVLILRPYVRCTLFSIITEAVILSVSDSFSVVKKKTDKCHRNVGGYFQRDPPCVDALNLSFELRSVEEMNNVLYSMGLWF